MKNWNMKILKKTTLLLLIFCSIILGIIYLDNYKIYTLRQVQFYLRTNFVTIIPNYLAGKNIKTSFSIQIKEKDKFNNLRNSALNSGEKRIPKAIKDKKFKGSLVFNEDLDTTGIKVRLNGQNMDHISLFNHKWSLKINSKKKFNGLKKFRLLVPETRSKTPINEFICHLLLSEENQLNLKYQFLKGKVNDNTGIYALEERVSNQFFKSNNIDSGFAFKGTKEIIHLHNISKEKAEKSMNYINNFWSTDGIDSIFDLQKLAAHYAIADLVDGHHTHWRVNCLYVFDYKTKKISPIGSEWSTPYSLIKPSKTFDLFFLNPEIELDYHEKFIKNKQLKKEYIKCLKKISQEQYIQQFISNNKEKIENQFNILNWEYYLTEFDTNFLYDNASKVQLLIPLLEKN